MKLIHLFSAKARFRDALEASIDRNLQHLENMKNAKIIKNRLREELRKAVYLKIYALPAPKFKVGDEVRVDCARDNFSSAWDNLGPPLEIGRDELATVKSISADYSRLEELLVEDYRNDSFLRSWTGEARWVEEKRWNPQLKHQMFPPELSVADLDTPLFAKRIKEFTDKISINWSYRLNFDRPAIRGIQWGINEKYLANPLPVEVWE